jgi:type IV fimbrial biogenesis protein FimT
MRKRYTKTGITSEQACPFVCQLIPFVGIGEPVITPFISKKIPLVGNNGFTLIELIVAITIIGILAAMAGPSMWTFFSQNRLSSQINELIADINLARSEAIKRSTTAGICATAINGTACAGGNWANGWMSYYIDPATNATVTLRLHQQLIGNSTLTSAAGAIVYTKDGTVTSGTGDYDLCDTQLHRFRRVNISTSGRPTLITLAADGC